MTLTSNVAEPTFSRVSLAVHVTLVVPTGKRLPEGGMHTTGRSPSTRSYADEVNTTIAPSGSSVSTSMLAGTVTTGGVVSRILTSKSRSSCSDSYVATQLTTVRSIGNVEPDGGVQVTVATLPFHVALTSKVTTRPSGPVASSVIPFGIVHCQSGGSAAASGAMSPARRSVRISLRVITPIQRARGRATELPLPTLPRASNLPRSHLQP